MSETNIFPSPIPVDAASKIVSIVFSKKIRNDNGNISSLNVCGAVGYSSVYMPFFSLPSGNIPISKN
jgi:hypothetical protein